jgi:hypothetical protein
LVDQEVRTRTELLRFLDLPAHAGAKEIELVYLERRAETVKRFQDGDRSARFVVERLDGVFGRLVGIGAAAKDAAAESAEEDQASNNVVVEAKEPAFIRPAGSIREANGSLFCGISACLVVFWAFSVYWPSRRESSLNILNLLQSPVFFLVFLLALAAEILARATLRDGARVRYLIKQGLEPAQSLDETQISRARVGRYLGWIAVALAILLAILLISSFSHFLRG